MVYIVNRILGCSEGRSARTWVDFSLYGHQIVAHLVKDYNAASVANNVDGDPVPVPHFGLALTVDQFHELADRVKNSDVSFEIQPHIRFEGAPGEQVGTPPPPFANPRSGASWVECTGVKTDLYLKPVV